MDEILHMFVEDTKEHLANIESNLMDMEQAGVSIDEEIVNKVFRAAHSIKGGAGFLNLRNIRELSHKLESILHMIRNRELVPNNQIITALLGGFDRLVSLCEHVEASDEEDIQDALDVLKKLTLQLLPESERVGMDTCKNVGSPGSPFVFQVTELDLNQALKGGKYLYIVEYDLIHDVQAKGKTPLEIISGMESAGLILDCKIDFDAVGVLCDEIVNSIPFIVLFATIIEPDLIGHLFSVGNDHITRIDPGRLPASTPIDYGQPDADLLNSPIQEHVCFGDVHVNCYDRICLLTAHGALTRAGAATMQQALLFILEKNLDAHCDLTQVAECDSMCLQLLMSAGKTFRGRNMHFTYKDGLPQVLADLAKRAGVRTETFFA
ncbi:Hpt domain-containing protein [Desulfovibrio inopinatus]|uniref:Hpt domain-containing protein n=1 Tax=Desulfovibrio inopinatus TaxID=102109 RepID=UPI000404320D|nr:Hpt domain-containing protein [Desulfovibrio inopinatus]